MFLFEGKFGNILHTGDCRLIPEILQCLPQKYLAGKKKEHCPLDFVFLDCTFGRSPFKMPCKQLAIQQVNRFLVLSSIVIWVPSYTSGFS